MTYFGVQYNTHNDKLKVDFATGNPSIEKKLKALGGVKYPPNGVIVVFEIPQDVTIGILKRIFNDQESKS